MQLLYILKQRHYQLNIFTCLVHTKTTCLPLANWFMVIINKNRNSNARTKFEKQSLTWTRMFCRMLELLRWKRIRPK